MLRTVTFSDAAVAQMANSKFVPVWLNRAPGFHNCEKSTEEHIFERSQEAYATRNICTFFMTADKKVVHYVAGYYAPDLFLGAMKFADGLKAKGAADQQRDHATRATEMDAEVARLIEAAETRKWQPALAKYGCYSYLGKHKHGYQCLDSLIEATQYWGDLHRHFAERKSLPDFEAVRSDYLYGNSFSEEQKWRKTPTGGDRRDPGTPTEGADE